MAEQPAGRGARSDGALPAELERRIAALEQAPEARRDFDAFAWGWMLLLGIGVPALLLLAGWLAAP